MCGRYTLHTPADVLARRFRVDFLEAADEAPRFNIAPTQPVPVVRPREGTRLEGNGSARELVEVRWGLLPSWVEDPDDWPTLLNARAETLHRKPAFRKAVRSRRCLVPADGFYEWRKEGEGKQPYHVRPRDPEEPVAFAGLWERWRPADGREAVDSCTIVTTEANDYLRPLHPRMPVILAGPEDEALWLDAEVREYGELEALLAPLSSDRLVAYPVSRRVNRVAEDEPSLIEPIAEALPHGDAPGEPGEPPRAAAPPDGQLPLL